MVVILKENPNEKQLENLKNWLTSLGLEIHESPNFSPSCRDTFPTRAVLSAETGI